MRKIILTTAFAVAACPLLMFAQAGSTAPSGTNDGSANKMSKKNTKKSKKKKGETSGTESAPK